MKKRLGQQDFEFLKDKLVWYNGHSPEQAIRIAAGVKLRLYG